MGNGKWEIRNGKEEEYLLDRFKDHKMKSIPHNTIHDGVKEWTKCV
jgi:hypothetical protein